MQTQPPGYDQWHELYSLEDDTLSPWHAFVMRSLRATDLMDRVVLEIGCGRGGLSHYISTSAMAPRKLFACDYSEKALAIAREKFGPSTVIAWQQEDIQRLTFADETFDTVISCETIEHVPNPKQALSELYRVLKPGGRLLLTCPNYFNLFGLWCIYRSIIGKPYTEGQPYVNYLIYPRLIHWVKDVGFSVESVVTSNLVLPLRAHYHFFTDRMPPVIRWLGFRTYFILKK